MTHSHTATLAAPRAATVASLRLRGTWHYAVAVLVCITAGIAAQRSFLAVQLDAQRDTARHRLEFFAKSLETLLERNEALPSLLALESKVGTVLDADTPAARDAASRHLEAVARIAQVGAAYLLNDKGLAIAASNWNQPQSFVDHSYAFRPYFEEASTGGSAASTVSA